MARAKGSLVPMRGSVEDWGPGRYQRNLERKDSYARKMLEQLAEGPPDFEKLLSAGVPRPERNEHPKKKTTKAEKQSKKKSTGRRTRKK